jgi:hypothetical protein
MRALEDKARPILVPLIEGNETRLMASDQGIIAAWAALKAMVVEYDRIANVTTNHVWRKYMRINSLAPPRGWGIWIGHYDRKDWRPEWISHPLRILDGKNAKCGAGKPVTRFNSQSTTQVIGKLFIQIIRCPVVGVVEGWRFAAPHSGTLFRIWPPNGYSIVWPGLPMTDIDADRTATAFFNFAFRVGLPQARAAIAHGDHPKN